ncbi:undecaprenyl-diphosphate phosphatase [Halobacillus naozhouensis]|uniref:Undecaprenyl-diphosphatase n=1 Tax=Halobacillus naozhouensis TaxID=554880 RepID=A0ABY8IU42_9BACI|nr:undecaprenyl-diphosphate phosphatase [Halobacillus naozhouensis]WFT73608.1 undecaprenyl-diphosphate phosphatase [Halobacillus naozhouensis]
MQDLWLLLTYLFLGLFQGFTEPIPISSSGHLVILQELIDMKNEGLDFLILVNFGSLIAVLIIYRNDIMRLIQNGIGYILSRDSKLKDDFYFIIYLIIGTIPAGVLGILFGDFIEAELNEVWIVGVTLLITGLALWIIRDLRGNKNEGSITWKDALLVGLAQGVALIPGISRSGATIVAAMLLGMKQETALRFSFLLYIPVSLGTMILSIDTLIERSLSQVWALYTIAFIASIIASYGALKWFMNIMAQGKLKYFSFYCFIVGGLVLLFIS